MSAITICESPATLTRAPDFHIDTTWTRFFNVKQAIASVYAHIAALPSSRTPEQHTRAVYETGLQYYLDKFGPYLPTPDLMRLYIAHLSGDRGLQSTTIGSKYLAPLRHYLRALANQEIGLVELTDRDFRYVTQCQQRIRAASEIPTPSHETTSSRPALYQHGNRLTWSQVCQVFDSVAAEWNTLGGKRDLAILYIGFTTGMRLAEIARITPEAIRQGEHCWELTVRGKRNNIDPVPVDGNAVKLIHAYLDAYTAAVGTHGCASGEVWYPFTRSGRIIPNAVPLSTQGIRRIITRRVEAATGIKISPHDMRRTVAAEARRNGMDYDKVRVLLRHKSISTTERYVGVLPNLSTCLITNFVHVDLPI